MHNRHDHLELLALIEDELDAAAAAPLRKRLANEPRILEMVERMRHDRAALRMLGEVHAPTDVLDQLELILARPMLAEPLEPTSAPAAVNGTMYASPGQFRRQHRRQALRLRWRRIAVAAIVLLALIAGVWAAMNGLNPSRDRSDDGLVAISDADRLTPDAPRFEGAELENFSGTIHHALPSLTTRHPLLASRGSSTTDSVKPVAASSTPQIVVAEFAIVMQAADADAAETALASIAKGTNEHIALVRNFSFAEATRIAEEVRMARGPRRDADQAPVTASTDGASAPSDLRLKSLADSVRRQIDTSTLQVSAADSSGHITGPAEIAPSLEQQLDFSSRGATHSVAVPVSDLKSFVERAAMAGNHSTWLRMLPARDKQISSESLSAWVQELEQLQKAFERLVKTSPDAVVQIPVLVQKD